MNLGFRQISEMAFWASIAPDPRIFVHIAATKEGICRIGLGESGHQFIQRLRLQQPLYTWRESRETPVIREAVIQLTAYFRRELTSFDLPLDLHGTDFQLTVWESLRRIPYGHVRTYAEIARDIGRPKATRAVGGANHENPVPIIVPCHRVVAASGKLGGFACGLDHKRLLLDIEQMTGTI
jgi:methylated-DNA-[protein]-cysteine S-methyltransferase